MALEAQTHVEAGKRLKGLLEEALWSIKELNKEASSLKDEAATTFDQYFERGKGHLAFFYPNLDPSQMDLFKVVRDGQV